jgi:uncharacterized membrane protein (DUF4010 family)
MDSLDPFLRLGAALAIGFLIGFERGWRKRDDPEGSRTAGLRTFALIGLVGGVAGFLAGASRDALGVAIIGAGFLAVAALAVAMYLTSVREHGNIGATTEFATLVAYGLGALAGHGEMVLALAAALTTVALLDTKAPLHGFLQRIQHDELRSALKLLLVSAVLLPILPDRGFGPGAILNPYKLWWIVVLVAGLSLAGHFARRFAGPDAGPVLTGLIGGLISSTAVSVSAARLATQQHASGAAQAACVAAAQAMMCLRIVVVAGVLAPPLAPLLIPPLGAAAAASFLGAYVLVRGDRARRRAEGGGGEPREPPKVPDDLGAAIVFAAILAGVMLATHYAREWFGISGLYATAALAGLVDVDAIAVTAATMAETPARAAVAAILIAAAVNTLAKLGIAFAMGPRGFALRVAAQAAAALGAGAAGYGAASLF